MLRFLTELLPPRIGTARRQHDPGRRVSRPQLAYHPCDETSPSFLSVVHHHQKLSGHLRESRQLLIRHIDRRGQESRVPTNRRQVMAQLRGQACLAGSPRPRHHSDSNVATMSSLRRCGSIRRRCPLAKLTDLIALLIWHRTMSRPHKLQGCGILGQLGISRSQDLLNVPPGRKHTIRDATAQPSNVHADIPLPVVDILSARRQCSFPIAI